MKLISANARRWAGYNRHRAKFREQDRARRLARSEAKQAEYVADYVAPKVCVPRVAAFAVVTIRFRDGRKAVLRTNHTPFGLTTSPSAAGVWLTRELQFQLTQT